MGFLSDLLGSLGGSSAECPRCGARMRGDGERFECPNACDGGVFFLEGGKLVNSMERGRGGSSSTCIACSQPLAGSNLTSAWEDGGNSEAYVTCRHCGAENYAF